MNSNFLLESFPLLLTFGSGVLIQFLPHGQKTRNFVLGILGFLLIFFTSLFFVPMAENLDANNSLFALGFNKISIFVGMILSGALLMGIFPVQKFIDFRKDFLFFLGAGIGIILADNLPTFFFFLTLHRLFPFMRFFQDFRNDNSIGGGTFILQHLLNFICSGFLLFLAYQQGLLFSPLALYPKEFFTWPVLILTFVIIYQTHGVFPFHSWVHDVVGKLAWYEISCLFLPRAGVLLFVQFLLSSYSHDPDVFKLLLLALSILSSVYWSFRGIFEENASKTTTYFYVAQSSLLLTGLQADLTAAQGSYLHMMVISFSGTALWSILSYIQYSFSLKKPSQFYGLAQYFPKLSTLFCLFGFCMIGVPLGASFVVEDLVITGLLEHQPYLGLGHIFATCLNGILFFLIFSKLFLGQPPYKQNVTQKDMGLLQMSPYLFSLLIMILIGITPFLFLEKIKW